MSALDLAALAREVADEFARTHPDAVAHAADQAGITPDEARHGFALEVHAILLILTTRGYLITLVAPPTPPTEEMH